MKRQKNWAKDGERGARALMWDFIRLDESNFRYLHLAF